MAWSKMIPHKDGKYQIRWRSWLSREMKLGSLEVKWHRGLPTYRHSPDEEFQSADNYLPLEFWYGLEPCTAP